MIVNEECSGDAFLFMNDEADCTRALGYNKKYMGKRYVEVMRSNAKEALEISQIKNRQIHTAKTVLKLKGIPYEATVHDIMNFLAPAPYKPFDVFLSPPGKCAFAFFSEAKHASAAMFLDRVSFSMFEFSMCTIGLICFA